MIPLLDYHANADEDVNEHTERAGDDANDRACPESAHARGFRGGVLQVMLMYSLSKFLPVSVLASIIKQHHGIYMRFTQTGAPQR